MGYVGKDVESIIRDLVEVAFKNTKEIGDPKVEHRAQDAAEEKILDLLLPGARTGSADNEGAKNNESTTRQKFRKMLREGQLDEKEIELELPQVSTHMEILLPGMEELTSQIQGMFQNLGSSGRKITKKLKIKDALKLITDEEAGKLINADDIKTQALKSAEQNGIVFVDEIDKIANRQELSGPEVSRQGVQRDLLPLVEGTSVTTKYGVVRTDHILFIGSGAFHLSKPSDLIPELQGRLPIRVELSSLSVDDFKSILTPLTRV